MNFLLRILKEAASYDNYGILDEEEEQEDNLFQPRRIEDRIQDELTKDIHENSTFYKKVYLVYLPDSEYKNTGFIVKSDYKNTALDIVLEHLKKKQKDFLFFDIINFYREYDRLINYHIIFNNLEYILKKLNELKTGKIQAFSFSNKK